MDTNNFNTISINGNEYFWRDVSKILGTTEEHHYRVAESALEDYCTSGDSFFTSDYDPPVYFAPLEVLKKDDVAIAEWCENHGMYFD